MGKLSKQERQFWRVRFAAPFCQTLNSIGAENIAAKNERFGSVFTGGSAASHISSIQTAQNTRLDCIEQWDELSEAARKVISATRNNWIAQGCRLQKRKKSAVSAKQAIPAAQTNKSVGTSDDLSGWALKLIGWRVAGVGETA